MDVNNAVHTAQLAVVRSALARARNAQLLIGGVLFAFASIGAGSFNGEGRTSTKLVSTLCLILLTSAAVILFWVALTKSNPNRSRLVLALRNHPDTLVWIYAQDIASGTESGPARIRDRNVYVKFADGSTVALTVRKERADRLFEALKTLAPGVAEGFTAEREEQFKRDPRSLRADHHGAAPRPAG
jgi:hypothetical protein